MRGIIHAELAQYVISRAGSNEEWEALLAEAGLEGRHYLSSETYPDDELFGLVLAESRRSGKPIPAILVEFGRHLAPPLAHTYSAFIPDHWRTLDLLEHTEETIHKAVRRKGPGATPPNLSCTRVSETEVHISYRSERRLCALAKGIISGVADVYGERVVTRDESCMHAGDPSCELSVELVTSEIEPGEPAAALEQ